MLKLVEVVWSFISRFVASTYCFVLIVLKYLDIVCRIIAVFKSEAVMTE